LKAILAERYVSTLASEVMFAIRTGWDYSRQLGFCHMSKVTGIAIELAVGS